VTPHTLIFTPEAQEQLVALYHYISVAASPKIAERYTDAIITQCEGLRDFPNRGTLRDDVRPGLRMTNYKKRAVIAFTVDVKRVSIIGIYYGGQDYESALLSELDE
jgi:toxin ParE1/3/4